jgi:hypothetical protein
MVLAGLILIGLAWPVVFYGMLFAGGGHSSPFEGRPSEAVFGATVLIGPLMMVATGIACLAAVTVRRAKFAALLALAIPIVAAVGAVALRQANTPDPPVGYLVPADAGVIPPMRTVATGPTVVSIACSASTGECVSEPETVGNSTSAEVRPPAKH